MCPERPGGGEDAPGADPPPGDGPTEAGGGPAWERVKEVLADAMDLPVAERAAFLDAACAGDRALRAEVASLLPDESGPADFLEVPATELFAVPAPEPGARIGGYEIRGVIGEGGMGRVYEATQERPHRTVALKVLRPGFLSEELERRFRWEVEALGRLSHPAIAQVHDAGVEMFSGHPVSWFAMEKVPGRPLLAAADHLGLDRAARLSLFLGVCAGVAHAHQRGVIHRDLKPDNILVDDEARPHILDFGIARAADPLASSVTTVGEIVGTLAYMSPEQVLGDPGKVDARCDVYSLGVILFRLLTGRPPLALDGLALPQAALMLSTEDPPPAGRVDPTLKGDLETVLATALAREVDRRYPTVDAFAADVARVLRDEPIMARQPTTWETLRRFARRNRGMVAAVAAAVLGLLAAVVGTSVGLLRARQATKTAFEERDRAREANLRAERALAAVAVERDRARAANAFLEQLLGSANPEQDGRDVRVADLLDAASAELFADEGLEPAVRATLHLTLAQTYRSLGLQVEAAPHAEAAVERFAAADGELAETTLEAVGERCELAAELFEIDLARQLAARLRDAVERRGESPDWLRIRPLELEASLAGAVGDLQGQEALARQLFDAWRAVEPEGNDTVETARNNLAVALLANGRGAEAAELLARGVEVRARTLGADDPEVLTLRINLAQALAEEGRHQEALAQMEEMLPAATAIWGPTHEKVLTLRNNRATALQEAGRLEESLAEYESLLDACVERYGVDHRETLVARNNLAVSYLAAERFARAEAVVRAGLQSLDRMGDAADPTVRLRMEMNLVPALGGQGREADALPVSARVVERLEELLGEAHQQTVIARNNHALLLVDVGMGDEAAALARRNQDLAEEARPGHPLNVFPLRMNLGRTLAAAGRFEEAEAELLAVEEWVRDHAEATDGQRARIREVLAQTYESWGRDDDAARWRGDG